jgi:hypothetical protein
MRVRNFAIAAGIWFALSIPAQASGGIWCTSADKKATISIGLGRVPVVAVLNIDIEAKGKSGRPQKLLG